MSHELRTPLNAILGFAQLLQHDRKEPLSPRHHERLSYVLRGGEHLLQLIDDILDLSKIEAGRLSMHLEAVAVTDVLTEVRETLAPLAATRDATLVIDGVPTGTVTADRTRLAQIAMNYGSNAIKYGKDGGIVRFTVHPARDGRIRISGDRRRRRHPARADRRSCSSRSSARARRPARSRAPASAS